jgi:hypothetical protein
MTCGHAAYLLIGFVPESGSFCPIAVFFSLRFFSIAAISPCGVRPEPF